MRWSSQSGCEVSLLGKREEWYQKKNRIFVWINSLEQKTLYRELKWKHAWQSALESCCGKRVKPSLTLSCQEAVPKAGPVLGSARGSPKPQPQGSLHVPCLDVTRVSSRAKALQVMYKQCHSIRSDHFKKRNSWMKAVRAKLFQSNC